MNLARYLSRPYGPTIEDQYPVQRLFPVWQYFRREAARAESCACHQEEKGNREFGKDLYKTKGYFETWKYQVEFQIGKNLEEAIELLNEL